MRKILLLAFLLMPATVALAQNAPVQLPPPPFQSPPPQVQTIQPQRGILHRESPYTPAQRATLSKINAVYNKIDAMNGTFVQAESNGERTSGKFYISKPGRVRFIYDAPSTLDIVSDGQQLVVRDKKLGTRDVYQLWQTPLRYLLKSKLDLMEDARITSLFQDETEIKVTIEEDGALTQGKLTLTFSATDYALQQWTTIDGNGATTNVVISNIEVNKPSSAAMFAL